MINKINVTIVYTGVCSVKTTLKHIKWKICSIWIEINEMKKQIERRKKNLY